jgi:hypothetical protein
MRLPLPLVSTEKGDMAARAWPGLLCILFEGDSGKSLTRKA